MSKYYNLSEDAIKTFTDIFEQKAFPLGIGFMYVGCEDQKELIKITKIPDTYNFLMSKELLVCMNEDLLSKFDQECITILVEQELDKISINLDTGKIKFVKPDLSTFTSLINKWGLEKVGRANQVEDLEHDQKLDSEQGFVKSVPGKKSTKNY